MTFVIIELLLMIGIISTSFWWPFLHFFHMVTEGILQIDLSKYLFKPG